MRRWKTGFSLVEVVISVFVLGLILSVGALSFQSSVSRERSKGLSHALAAELRAARSMALQSEKFVVVCLPNGDTGNPFSRSFAIRGGYDRGDLLRTVNFDDDLSATIFTGRWPGDQMETFPELPSWIGKESSEYRLVFRPDGTVLSEDIPSRDGKYQFVVATNMEAGESGLTAISQPTTIWVSKAGTIGVQENTLPSGSLPTSGTVPQIAKLEASPAPNTNLDPQVAAVDFLPIEVEGLENVGLGQTAVQIHPQQKRQGMGQNGIEYSLTTFRFRARDLDGGPLTFQIKAKSSAGDPGNFSYQEAASALGPITGGQMDFVQTETGEWVWESVISWRPPPGAPMGTYYDFELTVEDPDGHQTVLASGGELLPRIALLRPENIVYETEDHKLLMTNLDGTSHRRLTTDTQAESEPFFSSDGTRLYSFFSTLDELSIITRNSDGTNRVKLREFPLSYFRKITFDPFKSYAAYLTGSSQTLVVHFKVLKSKQVEIQVEDDAEVPIAHGEGETQSGTQIVTVYYLEDGSTTIDINTLEVMHLNSGKRVNISDHAEANFKWYGNPRFGLAFTEKDIYDEDDKVAPPAQDPRAVAQGLAEVLPAYIPSPGHKTERREVVIRGYPPRPEAQDLPDLSAGHQSEVFNLARPRYFLEHKNVAPCLTFHDSSGTLTNKVVSNAEVKSPSWSANGRDVLYARENGGSVDICKMTLLNEALDALEVGTEEVLYSAQGVREPRLSASGDFAFFLRGGEIYRLDLNRRGEPINLTKNLESKVLSYVLSP